MSDTSEPTNETKPLKRVEVTWTFSPRADITALEAAHVAALFGGALQGVRAEQSASWPWCKRHFEAVEVPVEDEAKEPDDSHD